MSTRTQDEILARQQTADDFFGFASEILIGAMTADTVRRMNPQADLPDDWTAAGVDELTAEARDYLAFAVGKATDHRGLSAERSVVKLREFAWLLGRDDVVQAMDAAEYPQYGVPKLKTFAEGMGWPFKAEHDWEQAALDRMARGEECRPEGCDEGCGQ